MHRHIADVDFSELLPVDWYAEDIVMHVKEALPAHLQWAAS